MRLEDKVAIITGAGQGIGEAYARRFAKEGARVVVADVNAEKGAAVARDIGQVFERVDVSSEDDTKRLCRAVAERFGRIDVLINNAAIFFGIDNQNTSYAYLRKIFEVNYFGAWLMCRAVFPHMRDGGGGSIINQSSGAAYVHPEYPIEGELPSFHYSVTKAAMNAMTHYMAGSVGRYNIRVNAIAPGPTMTEATRQGVPAHFLDMIQELAPLRRVTPVGLHRAPRPVGVRERELRSGVPLAFELLRAEAEHLARLLDLGQVGRVEAAEVAIGERPRGRRSAGLERAPEEALGLRQARVVDVLPRERPVGARRHLARDVVGQHLRRLEQDALLGLQDVPDVPLLLRVGHAREIGDVPEPHLGQLLYDLPQLLPLLAELGRPVAAPGIGEARSGDEEGERAHDAARLAVPGRVLLGRGDLEELRAPAPELHVELLAHGPPRGRGAPAGYRHSRAQT